MPSDSALTAASSKTETSALEARHACGTASGTFGEFLQGSFPTGRELLVSCPVPLAAKVKVLIQPHASLQITGLKPYQSKLAKALRLALETWAPTSEWRIDATHHSNLDVEKGMGSSTGDILAGIRAVASAFNRTPSSQVLARMASTLEPTDTVICDELLALERGSGAVLHSFPWWPSFWLVGVIPPTRLATSAAPRPTTRSEENEYALLFEQLIESAAAGDPTPWAQVATRSAEMSQSARTNSWLPFLRQQMCPFGALGVVTAHSGTVTGLLFKDSTGGALAARHAADALDKRWGKEVKILHTKIPGPHPD